MQHQSTVGSYGPKTPTSLEGRLPEKCPEKGVAGGLNANVSLSVGDAVGDVSEASGHPLSVVMCTEYERFVNRISTHPRVRIEGCVR